MLADDAEARGAREEAAASHEDRIEAATAAAASLEGLEMFSARDFKAASSFFDLDGEVGGRCLCRGVGANPVSDCPSFGVALHLFV